MYTLFIPCCRLVIQPASFRSWSFAKRLPARCSFIFRNKKSPTVPGPDCTEDARRCPNGIAHASKACACWVVCGRALSCNRKIARESLPLLQDNVRSHRMQKTNNTSHLIVGGILNRHLPRDKVRRTTSWRNFHRTEHQKPMIGCNRTGAWTVCANVLYFLVGLRKNSIFWKYRSRNIFSWKTPSATFSS